MKYDVRGISRGQPATELANVERYLPMLLEEFEKITIVNRTSFIMFFLQPMCILSRGEFSEK